MQKREKKSKKGAETQLEQPAQPQERTIRSLTADPAVASGTLANGVKYYIATNSTETGLAEFALVRKIPYKADADSIAQRTRELLSSLTRFGGQSVRGFVAGNGGYAVRGSMLLDGGHVSVQDDAVICRFGALPIATRSTATDSTLLMIFDIIENLQRGGDLPAGYSTSDNAIIIAGDVDKSSILTKLENFSMIAGKVSVPGGQERTYYWQPRDTVICTVDSNAATNTAWLTVSYASPRTPDKYMGTVLPAVSNHFAEILGIILQRRITVEMRAADIPLVRVMCNYFSSADGPGDEHYDITVAVAPEDAEAACRVLASVIADLDAFGVIRQAYASARSEYLTKLYVASQRTVIPNSAYVDKCIASFLYGATPTTDTEKWAFLGKGVADTSATRRFNNFVGSLLSGTENLTISLRTSKPSAIWPERLEGIFRSECGIPAADRTRKLYPINQSDTLSFSAPDERVKVESERTDGVSGGTKWVFSNGVTVVYKRMDTQGLFYYNLLIRGGFSSLAGLNRGEGAYLNDMLSIYDVGGVKGENFEYLMQSNGITVQSEVSVSDMSIYGVATRPSLSLLMKMLTAFTNAGTVDRNRFDYFRRTELLRLEAGKWDRDARNAVIDSMFSPSYRYYTDKTVTGVHEGVAELAEKFFNEQFSRINDGVFVIVGDMNPDLMKKFLTKYIGGFRTNGTYSMRSRLDYSPVTGGSTYIADGERLSVDVAISVPYTYTADNYMVTRVAELAVQDVLNKRLVGTGTVTKVRADFFSYPQERATFLATVEDVPLEALPFDEKYVSEIDLLFMIRRALKGLEMDPADLTMYKTLVKNEYKSRQNDPRYWLYMVKARVSDIKDLNSKYSDRIDAVTAAKVAELLSILETGTRVEYIVRPPMH